MPDDRVATDALGEVFEREAGRLWRAVFAYAQDRRVTDDAVAEAFAQCLRRGAEVRDQRAWVWRAAFRLAAGDLRERRRTGPLVDRAVEDGHGVDHVLAALAALPGNQRVAAVMHWYGGYGTDTIADVLGVSRATVRVHLSRARKRLRDVLADEEEVR